MKKLIIISCLFLSGCYSGPWSAVPVAYDVYTDMSRVRYYYKDYRVGPYFEKRTEPDPRYYVCEQTEDPHRVLCKRIELF